MTQFSFIYHLYSISRHFGNRRWGYACVSVFFSCFSHFLPTNKVWNESGGNLRVGLGPQRVLPLGLLPWKNWRMTCQTARFWQTQPTYNSGASGWSCGTATLKLGAFPGQQGGWWDGLSPLLGARFGLKIWEMLGKICVTSGCFLHEFLFQSWDDTIAVHSHIRTKYQGTDDQNPGWDFVCEHYDGGCYSIHNSGTIFQVCSKVLQSKSVASKEQPTVAHRYRQMVLRLWWYSHQVQCWTVWSLTYHLKPSSQESGWYLILLGVSSPHLYTSMMVNDWH